MERWYILAILCDLDLMYKKLILVIHYIIVFTPQGVIQKEKEDWELKKTRERRDMEQERFQLEEMKRDLEKQEVPYIMYIQSVFDGCEQKDQ